MPVVPAVSQSTLPQAQADGLAAEPSVMAHAAGREHVLDVAVQTMPVPCPSALLVHGVSPHMHVAALLIADPSLILQAEAVMPEENVAANACEFNWLLHPEHVHRLFVVHELHVWPGVGTAFAIPRTGVLLKQSLPKHPVTFWPHVESTENTQCTQKIEWISSHS